MTGRVLQTNGGHQVEEGGQAGCCEYCTRRQGQLRKVHSKLGGYTHDVTGWVGHDVVSRHELQPLRTYLYSNRNMEMKIGTLKLN